MRALQKLNKKVTQLQESHAAAIKQAEKEKEKLIQEHDAARKTAEKAKGKKRKKKSSHKSSAKFNAQTQHHYWLPGGGCQWHRLL